MATVRDIVYDAMAAVGIYFPDENTPDDASSQLALRRLQRMVDQWAGDNLMIYSTADETMSLSAGVASYTTLNLSTPTRPANIEPGYIEMSGVSYPLSPMSAQEYDAIGYKSAQGIPSRVFYNPTMPNGAFTFYLVPMGAMTAHFTTRRLILSASLTLDTVISLPPGYDKALCDNLALELTFGGFGDATASPDLRQQAKNGKDILRRQNYSVPVMSTVFDEEISPDAFIYRGF